MRLTNAVFLGLYGEMDLNADIYKYSADHIEERLSELRTSMSNALWHFLSESNDFYFARKTLRQNNESKSIVEAWITKTNNQIYVAMIDRTVLAGVESLHNSKYGEWIDGNFLPRYKKFCAESPTNAAAANK
jgi:hypothetical protein